MNAALIALTALFASNGAYFSDEATCQATWTRVAETPLAAEGWKPQGLAFMDGAPLLAAYEGETAKLFTLRRGAWAEVAVTGAAPYHASGLEPTAGGWWLIDYVSGHVLKLVPDGPDRLRAVIDHDTGEPEISAGFERDGTLWVSVFGGTGAYLGFPIEGDRLGPPERRPAAGYIQGDAIADGRVYQAVNKIGTDEIHVYGPDDARTMVFNAPGDLVEDLHVEDGVLWTSDEDNFGLFKTDLAAIRCEG